MYGVMACRLILQAFPRRHWRFTSMAFNGVLIHTRHTSPLTFFLMASWIPLILLAGRHHAIKAIDLTTFVPFKDIFHVVVAEKILPFIPAFPATRIIKKTELS